MNLYTDVAVTIGSIASTDPPLQINYSLLKYIYSTEMEIPYPIMKNVSIGVAGVNVNAISTYYNPGGVTENESLRK